MTKILNFKFLSDLIYIFIVLVFLFGRSFMGIYILGFRIGELLVGFCLISSLLLLINFSENKKIFGNKTLYLHLIIWLSFLISLFINGGDFLRLYNFKSSSYIWAISMIYVGAILFKYFTFTKSKILFLNFSLVYVYILSTVYYPQFLSNFFINYSDKWDFNKASSLGIFFVVTILLNNKFQNYFKYSLEFFVIVSSLFLPLFLFKSRGSFIAIFLFIVTQLYLNKNKIFKNEYKTYILIFIALIVAMLSTIRVLNQDVAELVEEQKILSIFYSGEAVDKLKSQKDTRVESFISFYTKEGRLYSIDGNINWRMQIWQDVIFDSLKERKVFFGNGYSEIIPAMKKFERKGRDGLNENVHNFLINIYARGGLFQLFTFICFYYCLINNKNNKIDKDLLQLTFAVFIISLFDTSMENSHFPVIYYLFSSFFLLDRNNS